MRIELPQGNWAEIREPDDLYDEDRKEVLKAFSFGFDPDTGQRIYSAGTDDAVADALLKRVVTNWSYTTLAIPSKNPGSIGKLKISHARALREGVAAHLRVVYGTEEPDPTGGENSSSSSQTELVTVA